MPPTNLSHSPSMSAPEITFVGFEFKTVFASRRLQESTSITDVKIEGLEPPQTWKNFCPLRPVEISAGSTREIFAKSR
jgi:hypothetical protein